MHPSRIISSKRPFPTTNRVFVAMPFSKDFDIRYENVYRPAVMGILMNEKPLEPYRADIGAAGESIHYEMINELLVSQFILSDISTVGIIDDRPVRNHNVLYEIGMAHAIRPPSDVLIFRSDNDVLPFDVLSIRIHTVDFDDPDIAIAKIRTLILDALKIRDLELYSAVDSAAKSLSYDSAILLLQSAQGPVKHPVIRTMGDVMSYSRRLDSINSLLEKELIELSPDVIGTTKPVGNGEDLFVYNISHFGSIVAKKIAGKFKGIA